MSDILAIPPLFEGEDTEEIRTQVKQLEEYRRLKRRWENAFQKWSDEHGMVDGTEDYGSCGYGSMCDWCKDNSYGRPCVRALNAMLRENGKKVDYDDTDFVKVWRGW